MSEIKEDAPKDLTPEEKEVQIEEIFKRNVKSKTLIEEAYNYMAKLVIEDCPKNARELLGLIGDFLSDGMAYSEIDADKLCGILYKQLKEKNLVNV